MPHGRTTEIRALILHNGVSLHVNLSLSEFEHDKTLQWSNFVRRDKTEPLQLSGKVRIETGLFAHRKFP